MVLPAAAHRGRVLAVASVVIVLAGSAATAGVVTAGKGTAPGPGHSTGAVPVAPTSRPPGSSDTPGPAAVSPTGSARGATASPAPRRRAAPRATRARVRSTERGQPTARASSSTDSADRPARCLNARGVPTCGAFVGAAYGANTDPAPFEARTGHRLGIRRTYFTATQVDSAVRIARSDLAAGRLPWISFKLPFSWSDMADGRGDRWADGLAARLATLPGPVWVAFHHEPEGDGDISQWRRMQERLAPLVRAAAPNVAYTVVLTGWHELYGSSEYRLDALWPRGVKIDVVGFDVYNQLGVVKNGATNTTGTDLARSYFAPLAAWSRTHHVAWGLAETGCTDDASRSDPDWIRRTSRQLESLGGVAFTYFDTTLNSIAPWAITAAAKLHDFARAQAGSLMLPVR